MAVTTYIGVVEQGRIQLCDNVSLPENAKVYVVVPEGVSTPTAQILSPRLADPAQASQLTKQVIKADSNA